MTQNIWSFLNRRRRTVVLFNFVVLFINVLVWTDFKLTTSDSTSQEFYQTYDPVVQNAVVESWKNARSDGSKVGLPMSDAMFEGTKTKSFLGEQEMLRPSISYDLYQVPRIKYPDLVNCASILGGDSVELDKAEKIVKEQPKVPIYEETYLDWTRNCDQFKSERGYVQMPLSKEEEEFPLAFSIAMFRDVEQTERLLRAIYQPQNFYCIHVDTKSSLLIHRTMRSIAACFDNVWISTHLDKIKWGDISVILSEINCMRDLIKYFRGKYRYFINLTGQEFPLRTNLELVRIAKIFNGSNDIAGSTTRMDMERVNYIWTHRWSKTYQQTIFYNTFQRKEPYKFAPLTFFKGELHALFSNKMTEYIIESEQGQRYLEWCWDTGHPSEHYWNTLNYNKHLNAPGGYEGDLHLADVYSVHPVIRAKNWVDLFDDGWPCHGRVVRGICVYGLRDAPWLANRPELFINKFNLTFEYLGYDCLEERHRNRTMAKTATGFDEQYYKELPTVKYSRKDGL